MECMGHQMISIYPERWVDCKEDRYHMFRKQIDYCHFIQLDGYEHFHIGFSGTLEVPEFDYNSTNSMWTDHGISYNGEMTNWRPAELYNNHCNWYDVGCGKA